MTPEQLKVMQDSIGIQSSPAPSVLPDVSYDDMNGETFSLLGEIAKEQGYGESAWDETAKAMGIEIGVSMGGIYTTTKAMKYLNNFRKVRRVVQAGQLAAGTTGVGTVPALVSAVATEGAFALAGNYLSQKYQPQMIQAMKLAYEDEFARALAEDGSDSSTYITPQNYYPNA